MKEPIRVRTTHQAHCNDCSLAPLCLPLSLNMEDVATLDAIVKRGDEQLERFQKANSKK